MELRTIQKTMAQNRTMKVSLCVFDQKLIDGIELHENLVHYKGISSFIFETARNES